MLFDRLEKIKKLEGSFNFIYLYWFLFFIGVRLLEIFWYVLLMVIKVVVLIEENVVFLFLFIYIV